MGIFSDHATKWFESGYNILPLHAMSKRPAINGWQEWGKSRQSQFQLDAWESAYPNGNIGLPLGECNQVIALDFDNDADDLHKKIAALCPPSPCRKKGVKGYTAFYRYNGEPNKRWRSDGAGMVVELLSTGTQTVLPPSLHPDTQKPYQWVSEEELLDCDDLPSLPDDFIAKVDALMGYDKKPRLSSGSAGLAPDIDVIRDALRVIPSAAYATWVEVGMALHHSYGDSAFDMWDAWSATAPNYDPKAMNYKWQSFGKYGGEDITAASIIHYAMGYGWMPPAPQMDEDAVITLNGQDIAKIATPVSSVVKSTTSKGDAFEIPSHLLDAPNLVGRLSDWINGTSIRRQPALTLGASLCAIGAVMGHRFRTPSDLRSNIMAVGICGAGLGKDHARKAIGVLYDQAGIADVLLGDFASDAAIITALHRGGGIGLGMTDEMGDELAALSSKHSGSYESRIMRITKELFSSANSVYRGKEYANHKGDMNRKDINQPCLCVYGTSTPGQFFDALSGKKVLDGFLPRWLIFEGDGYAPRREGEVSALTPPYGLVNDISDVWASLPIDGSLTVGMVRPHIVDISEGARDKLNALSDYAEQRRIEEYERGSGLDALYARLYEHACKVALVAHRNRTIDYAVACWACELVMFLAERAVSLVRDNVSNSEYEGQLLDVLALIKRRGSIRRRELMRSKRSLPSRDLDKILHHLIETGNIEAQEEQKQGSKSVVLHFRQD